MLLAFDTWGEESPSLGVTHCMNLEELFEAIQPLSQNPEPLSVFVPDASSAQKAAWVQTVLQVPFDIVVLPGPVTRRALMVYLVNSLMRPEFHGVARHGVDVVDKYVETRFLLSSVFFLNHPKPSMVQMLQSPLPNAMFVADVRAQSVAKIAAVTAKTSKETTPVEPEEKWEPAPEGVSIISRNWSDSIQLPLQIIPARNHFVLEGVGKDLEWGQHRTKNWIERSWTNAPLETIGNALDKAIRPRQCDRCERYTMENTCLACGFTHESNPGVTVATKVMETV